MYAESAGQVEEFLQILRKRRWQVLVPTALVFCLSLAVAVIIPQKYHAEGEIEIRHYELGNRVGATSEALELGNADTQVVAVERVRMVLDLLKWDDYENLKLKSQKDPGMSVIDYIKRQKAATQVVAKYKEKTKPTSATIEVQYKNVDRDRAIAFVKTLLESWASDLSARDEELLARERDALQNERNASLLAFQAVLDEKSRIEQELGVVSFTHTGNFNSNSREDPFVSEFEENSSLLTAARAKSSGLQAKLADLDKRILEAEEYVLQDVEQSRTDIAALMTALEGEIADAKEKQRGLLPKHSQWIMLQDLIEKKEADLERAQKTPESSILRQERVLNRDRLDWIKQRDVLKIENRGLLAEIETLDLRTKDLELTIQQRITLKGELEVAASKVNAARFRYEEDDKVLHERIGNLSSLIRNNRQPLKWSTPPHAPAEPSEPNPLLIMAIGLAAGLAIGLGSSMLVEFTKNCYRSVSDVTAVMTLPILGVVNEIVTRQEKRSARWRGTIVISSSTVMLLVLAWFTWAYTRKPELLPPEFLRQFEELRGNFK